MLILAEKQRLFEERYRELFDSVYRYMVCRSPNITIADDLISDVFLEAWRCLKTYNETKSDLATWMRVIARRRLARYWSREAKAPLEFYNELPEKVEHALRSEGIDQSCDAQRAIDAIFAHFTPEERALCMFRFVDDLPYDVIAQRTGKTSGALRTHISRLTTKARSVFSSYEQS